MKKSLAFTILIVLSSSMIMNVLVINPPNSNRILTPKDGIPAITDNLSDNESYTQTVYTELEEISSRNEVEVTPHKSINSIQAGISYDSVEYHLLNFTYNKVYQSQSHQEDNNGIIQYNLNQTITTTVFASMPVMLAVYRNNSVAANDRTQILTQALVDENYKAKMGFSVDFDLDFFFKAQIFGIGPVIGPNDDNLPFDKSWTFNTPMNGQAVLSKVGVSFPSLIPLLNVGISVGPKIDTDFTASVKSNDSGIDISSDLLNWQKDGAFQAFSVKVPEFFSKDFVTTDLFNFDMEFLLSLVFYLDITIGLPIFNLPFHFPIFSFPVAVTHLQTENINSLNLVTDVFPSDDLPFVYGVAYNYSDQNGDNDGIVEPGDTINFSVITTNLGDGSALRLNSTADSVNVSISGEDSTPLLLKNRGNYELQKNFYFSIPSDYSGDFILVNVTFEYYSVNGSIWTSLYELYFRVVHSGDTYLEVSDVFLDHPDDYWKSGDQLGIFFNVTNRGSANITNAQILVAEAFDTDMVNTATLISDQTNISSVNIGISEILGFVNISTTAVHDDGLIYFYFYVYYEDTSFTYTDLLYFAIPIYFPKPVLTLLSSVGYETDSDSLFEANESVEIEFTVQNIGESEAFSVSGYITTDNPDLNITSPQIYIGNLAVSVSDISSRAFVEIPTTAKNQTATFTLHLTTIDAMGHKIYQNFNITLNIVELPPPNISLMSYSIDDSVYGNNDGNADPGEIFLLHINVQIENTGFSVTGSANTTSQLMFYNSSSFYGDLSNQISPGDGFIVEVPLNYPGGTSRIDITLFAESFSGRKLNTTGYLELTIDTGDITAPTMSLIDTIPNQVIQNDDLSFSVAVQDSSVVNEITSGIDRVLLIYMFNNGEIQINMVSDPDLDGNYDFELDTSIQGSFEFILISIDIAGNIQFLVDNNETFIVDVIQSTTTSTTTTSATSLQGLFILLAILSMDLVWRNKGKGR